MKTITPRQHINATVAVPGSKSITQRALIAAALAKGKSILLQPLTSEDTIYSSGALRALGIVIDQSDPNAWVIHGKGGRIIPPGADIYLGNNGTATRFLTSIAALGKGTFKITGDARMSERPIGPLIASLRGWGCNIRSTMGTDCPPLEIKGNGLAGGKTTLPEGKSSQYISSLLLAAPYTREEAELLVTGKIYSTPYVSMTLAVMKAFGVDAVADPDFSHFRIPRGIYQGREYAIEGDASSSSYFFAAAAITGGRVTVNNIPADSIQGDAIFVDLLEKMGCLVERKAQEITVTGMPILKAIDVDMSDCPDVAPTLAVVAAFAHGRSVIRNIGHLRIKECDRISAMATELKKLGVSVTEKEDLLLIDGVAGRRTDLSSAVIETYKDHRIAMCFAIAGLAIPGVVVTGEECVVKSFPTFWETLARI